MVTTVRDIINDMYLKLGVIAIGETPSAALVAQGLTALQDMLDLWQTESLTLFTVQPEVFPFDARASGQYTMGVGGDFDTTRPIRFSYITIRDSSNTDYPCEILDIQRYSAIPVKSVATALPYQCYPDMNYPLCKLYFYPVPSDSSYSAVIWTPQQLTEPSTLTEAISLPPGYRLPLKFNLAAYMGPAMGIAVSQDIKDFAINTKAQLKRQNIVIPVMACPGGLTRRQGYTQQDFLAGK